MQVGLNCMFDHIFSLKSETRHTNEYNKMCQNVFSTMV